jgi:hypothetical protein
VEIRTHDEFDIDGGIAIEKLRRFGKDKIPGIENAKIVFNEGNANDIPKENVVFVDICPKGVINNPSRNIKVYDHHPHDQWPGETSSSLVDKFLGFPDLENLELIKWAFSVKDTMDDDEVAKEIRSLYDELDLKNLELTRWAFRGDFQSGGDPMNIANALKRMHLIWEDEEVYQWFSMAIEAHFQVKETDFQKGIEFFKRTLEKFLSESKNSPAETQLQQCLARTEKAIEDKMNIVHRTAVNLSVYGLEKTEQWLMPIFKSIEEDQRQFKEVEEDFNRADKLLAGKRVVVIGESKNRAFNRYCRSAIAKAKMPRPLNEKEDPIVVQFQPENKGFQIFTNSGGYRLFDIAGALRIEVLRARNKEIPRDWQTLKAGGILPGTEPLYYQIGEYEVLLWGSPKHPNVPLLDIPRQIVVKIVTIAVDQQYYPRECQKSKECLRYGCELYPWMLWRCYKKRQQNRKPLNTNA